MGQPGFESAWDLIWEAGVLRRGLKEVKIGRQISLNPGHRDPTTLAISVSHSLAEPQGDA